MTDSTILGFGIIAVGLAFAVILIMVSKRPKSKPKKDKKKEKAITDLKKLRDDIKPPENVLPPPPLPLALPAPSVLQQSPIPRVIQIELTRMKESTSQRVTWRTGKVTLIPRFGNKDIFFFYVGKMGYFVDPSKIIIVEQMVGRNKTKVKVEKLVYDAFNGEPLNSDGSLTWSWDLERLWRDSVLDQYITVATFEGGFQLTPGLIKALIVVGFLGSLMGLAVNGSAHIIPTTLIHWVP